MLIGYLVFASLIAVMPAAANPATESQEGQPLETPSAQASSSVITDLTKLPLEILKSLPAPVNFDYDGDGQIDALGIGLDPQDRLVLKITSSRTKKAQALYTARKSLKAQGATAFGLNLSGGPTTGVEMTLWGVKNAKKLTPLTFSIKPFALGIIEEGKTRRASWTGSAFVIK